MTIEQFRPTASTRGKILYSKIKPHITDGMGIIDIGCAYAPIADFVATDFPQCKYFGFDNNGILILDCKLRLPNYEWRYLHVTANTDFEDKLPFSPDVVIHVGVDADWSNIWETHTGILEYYEPKAVLLETGRRDGYENCMVTYRNVIDVYIECGYKLVDTGRFDFDWDSQGKPCNRDRHYSILIKS